MEEHRINIMEDAPVAPQGAAPEEQEEEAKPAGVAERFIALLIDWSIVSIPYQLLAAWYVNRSSFTLEQIYWVFAGVNIPFIIYETIFSCGGRSTLGKKLVGIKVYNFKTGEPLGFFAAFVRAIGYYISAALLMCGFLLAMIDSNKRALHDYLSGSIVMQSRSKSWGEKTLLTLTGSVLLLIFCGYFYNQLFGSGSIVQQRLISRAQAQVENIGYLEEAHLFHYGYYTNDLLRLSLLSGDPVQFQRDTQKALYNRDFRIGISEDGKYRIQARAKDKKKTKVFYPKL